MQKAFHRERITFLRLVETRESLPFPRRGNGVSWDHKYGVLIHLDDKDHYTWEDRLMERADGSKTHQIAGEISYDVPGRSQLLTAPPQNPSRLDTLGLIGKGNGRFKRLPWKTREAIAIYVPIREA